MKCKKIIELEEKERLFYKGYVENFIIFKDLYIVEKIENNIL